MWFVSYIWCRGKCIWFACLHWHRHAQGVSERIFHSIPINQRWTSDRNKRHNKNRFSHLFHVTFSQYTQFQFFIFFFSHHFHKNVKICLTLISVNMISLMIFHEKSLKYKWFFCIDNFSADENVKYFLIFFALPQTQPGPHAAHF